VAPFGDAALIVTLGTQIDPGVNAAAHRLAGRVQADRAHGSPWRTPVPAYASVLLPYDPLQWLVDEARAALEPLLAALTDAAGTDEQAAGAVVEIPVRYGGDDGPDLVGVAARLDLTVEEAVALHASRTYRSYVLGFAPGFAYLGTLAPELRLPRRDSPRTRVPAGSVGIAGAQTAVYPRATPGGWHLIGRTEVVVWDALREPPALLAPGAMVRFVPV
jgi:inhibitor of KinA